MAEMDAHREHDIPVGVVVDRGVERRVDVHGVPRRARTRSHADGRPHRLADFTFPPDGAWPDPKGMVDDLHAEGVKVLLWQIPLLKMRPHRDRPAVAADAAAMVARGYAVREARRHGRTATAAGGSRGAHAGLSPTRGAATGGLAKRRYLVDETSASTGSRPTAANTRGATTCATPTAAGATRRTTASRCTTPRRTATCCARTARHRSRSAGPASPARRRTACSGRATRTPRGRRSGASMQAGLTAGGVRDRLLGLGPRRILRTAPAAELYLRAAAASAFLPIMQYHSEFNHHRTPSRDRTPWNIAEQTGDAWVLPVFRRYAQLRERLVPYLASSAARTIETGWPLLRSVCLVAPDDPRAWQHPYDYLLGDDLLVAPVVAEGATTRSAYLPPGRWLDLRTRQVLDGASEVEVPAPVDEIPVWCRLETAERHRGLFTSG